MYSECQHEMIMLGIIIIAIAMITTAILIMPRTEKKNWPPLLITIIFVVVITVLTRVELNRTVIVVNKPIDKQHYNAIILNGSVVASERIRFNSEGTYGKYTYPNVYEQNNTLIITTDQGRE